MKSLRNLVTFLTFCFRTENLNIFQKHKFLTNIYHTVYISSWSGLWAWLDTRIEVSGEVLVVSKHSDWNITNVFRKNYRKMHIYIIYVLGVSKKAQFKKMQ